MLKNCKRNKMLRNLLLTVGVVALSGCGSDSSTDGNSGGDSQNTSNSSQANSEKITLTLWHYYNGSTKDMLDNMVSEFNETVGAEKNIVVDAYSYSNVNDLAVVLVSSANKEVGTDNMPDIFAAYADTALLLDDIGVVAPIDDYFSEDEIALYRDDFLDEGRFDADGNLKILPVAKSTEILFINDTDFKVFSEATGIQMEQLQTWEGMAKTAEVYYEWTDAKTPDIPDDGQALFGIDSEANFMIVTSKQLEDEIYDYEDGDVSFGLSMESARKIWDYCITPYIKGHYLSQGSFRSDDIKAGDLLVYAGSTSSVYYFPSLVELSRTESYDIDGATLPYPHFAGGDKLVVQQGAGMLVSKTDEARESASVEFLKWFTAPENNLEFAVSTGYMPVQDNALDYDSVMEYMENSSDNEITKIVSSSVDTTYNKQLPEYEFYSNKPFDGSYDTRNVIKDVFVTTITSAKSTVDEAVANGVPKQEIVAELVSDESFEKWYNGLKNGIDAVLD